MVLFRYLYIYLLLSTGAQAAQLQGIIINPDSLPVPDAEIRLLNTSYTDISDNKGYFYFDNVPEGTFDVMVKHISYQSQVISRITISANSKTDLGVVVMRFGIYDTEDVIVTATRTEHQPFDLPQTVSVVSASKIIERASKSSAEALREQPAVFVQKTNHGGGSATLRGLSSNQILLMVDGIRLNNSIYRLGNHQYLTTVDFNMLDQIEVLHGPGSVQFGSDALGGTINLKTENPKLSKDIAYHRFSLFGRYATADNERTLYPKFSYHANRFALQAGLTLKNIDDLRRGSHTTSTKFETSDGRLQTPSGFSTLDFDAKLIFALSNTEILTSAFQRSTQNDVPRYDKYENDGYQRWLYDPQDRNLFYITYDRRNPGRLLNKMRLNLSFNQQKEGRIIQPAADSNTTIEKDNVHTYGISAQFDTPLRAHLITSGFDFYTDRVNSRRDIQNENSNTLSRQPRGRYPDGAIYSQFGLFLQDEISLKDRWLFTPGIRFSHHGTDFDLNADSTSNPVVDKVNQSFSSFTGSLGAVYRIFDHTKLSLLYSQGFRAPNLSDLSKLGESKGSVYEVPNTDLEPERSQNLELGIKLKTDKFQTHLAIYYTHLSDLLASADDSFQGRQTIMISGRLFQIKSKQNIGEGFVTGLEHRFRSRLGRCYTLHGHLTYTYGENTTLDEPIGGIPPLFGLLGLRYGQKSYSAEINSRFAGSQNRLSRDDKDDPRIPQGGTPGWYTINLRAKLTLYNKLDLYLSLENILDLNYREHGSGINAAGRNFIVSLQIRP